MEKRHTADKEDRAGMADKVEMEGMVDTEDTAPRAANRSPHHRWRIRTNVRMNALKFEVRRAGVLESGAPHRFVGTRAIPQARTGAASLHAIGLVRLDTLALRRVRSHAT